MVPVAIALTVMWLAAGFTALVTDRVQVFVIATGPFGVMCGYLFGVQLLRRAQNGEGEGT